MFKHKFEVYYLDDEGRKKLSKCIAYNPIDAIVMYQNLGLNVISITKKEQVGKDEECRILDKLDNNILLSINLNDFVKVKLNEKGVSIYCHQYDKLIEKGIDVENRMPEIDEEWFTKMQLHRLMNLYGEYLTVGIDIPFVDNNIYFEK